MKQVGPTEELPQNADVVLDMTGQIILPGLSAGYQMRMLTLELADPPRLQATSAGSPVRSRPSSSLGTPPPTWATDALPGSSRVFGAFGSARDISKGSKTLRKVSGAAQGPSLGSREALSGAQEGGLIT